MFKRTISLVAVVGLVFALAVVAVQPAQAADGTWTSGTGNWSDIANWNSGAGPIASGIGATATFDGATNSVTTVDAAYTVGILDLGAPGVNAYHHIGATGPLTLDGGASPAEINNLYPTSANYRPIISGTLLLDSDLEINNMGINKSPSNPITLKTNEIWTSAIIQPNTPGLKTLTNVSEGTACIWVYGNRVLKDGVGGNGALAVVQDSSTNVLYITNQRSLYTGGTFIKKGQIITTEGAPGTGTITIGEAGGPDASLVIYGSRTVSNEIALVSGATGAIGLGTNGYSTFSGQIFLNGADLTLTPTISSATLKIPAIADLDPDPEVEKWSGIQDAGGIIGAGTGTILIEQALPAAITGISNTSADSNLALGGANAYTGVHTISAGAMTFLNPSAISGGIPSFTPTKVAVSSGATLGLGVGGSGFSSAEVDTVVSQMILAAGTNLGLDTTSGNFTHANALTGAMGVTKLGANTLTLSGTNTYAGPTTISKGTLGIGATDSLPSGGTINISDIGTLSADVPGVSLAGRTVTLATGGKLSATGSGSLTIDGTTTLSSDAIITTADDGVVNFSGATYGGNLTVQGKTMVTGGTLTGNTTLDANGALTVDGGTMTGSMYIYGVRWSSPASLILTNGAQVGSASATAALGGWAKCDDNSAVVTGTGTVWTTGGSSFLVGLATLRNSVLITDGGKVVSTATDSGYGFSVGSVGGDDNVVTIQDGGTWDLTGGGNDRLVIGNCRGGATDSNLVEVKSGGSLLNVNSVRLGVDARNGAHDANSYDNKLNVYSGGIMELNTASPYVLINEVATGNAINMLSGATLSYKGVTGVDLNANTDYDVVDPPYTGNGVSKFTFAGNNIFRLNNSTETGTGAYTFANNLGVTNYTGLELYGVTSIDRGITIDGANGGSMLLDGATATVTGGVTLSGPATVTAQGTPSTLTGVITGGGSLLKAGAGTLNLASDNTYAGDTNVNAGTLKLTTGGNNNIPSSAKIIVGGGAILDVSAVAGGFQVVSGQTLGGDGDVSGNVTVNPGGTVAPGASVGTLTVNNDLTFADGGNTWVAELLGAGDRVDVTGTLTLGTATTLEFPFDGANPFQAGTYTLADCGTLTDGTTFSSVTNLGAYTPGVVYDYVNDEITIEVEAGLLAGDANLDRTVDLDDFARLRNNYGTGDTWVEADFNGDDTVNLDDFAILRNNYGSHVPEPATLALLGLGGLATLIRRRKRR